MIAFALLAVCVTAVYGQAVEGDAPQPVTLHRMRDRYRPLLIFSAKNSAVFREQLQLLAERIDELHERDVILIPMVLHNDRKPWGVVFGPQDVDVMPPREAARARRLFHVSDASFNVILLGKDGEEKLRASTPVTASSVCALIDSMPLRQQEMKARADSGR